MRSRVITAIAAAMIVAACSSEPKPLEAMNQADQAIAEAVQAGAAEHSPVRLASAQEKLIKARLLADEGESDEAELLAEEARADANAALADANAVRATTAEAQNTVLAAELADMEARESDRGYIVSLGDLLFATDSAVLNSDGLVRVNAIANFLRRNPGQAVVIEGHTDSIGDADYNLALSQARAESVAQALLNQGIARTSIISAGVGESAPVASNASAAGRQLNRRVDVIFVSL